MAILHHLKAVVLVDGEPLPEYEDDDEENQGPDTVVKYIEATTGAQFGLKISALESFKFTLDAISFYILLDGLYAENSLLLKENPAAQCTIKGASWANDQGWQQMPFIFSDINCVEDSISQRTRPSSGDVGTITIQVHRNTLRGKSTAKRSKPSSIAELEKKKEIAESKLKGMGVSHSIELGKAQKTGFRDAYETDYPDGIDSPFAVFKFKYRSKKALQAMILVPRSPTPIPLEDRPVDELNVEELRELARRQRARTSPERKVKTKPQRGFKRERDAEYNELLASATTKKVKRPRPSGDVEVIDLCGDD